jgi:hypothetical protein
MCDELWRNHNWLLHHNNAPGHTSLKTIDFVINKMVIVPYPQYLPDLATCDFALFPKLKIKLKGGFETLSEIQRESQAVLDSSKENDFQGAFKAWQK